MKKTFRVADMHCTNCVMKIENLEDELPGMRRVTASYQKQRVEVEFDEGRLTEQEIIAAIQKKGYTAVPQ